MGLSPPAAAPGRQDFEGPTFALGGDRDAWRAFWHACQSLDSPILLAGQILSPKAPLDR